MSLRKIYLMHFDYHEEGIRFDHASLLAIYGVHQPFDGLFGSIGLLLVLSKFHVFLRITLIQHLYSILIYFTLA